MICLPIMYPDKIAWYALSSGPGLEFMLMHAADLVLL
jgi:hypothetical protein